MRDFERDAVHGLECAEVAEEVVDFESGHPGLEI
jgi:hypothetical protein